jgi:hypothetical protein
MVDGKQLAGIAAWRSLYANQTKVMKNGREVTIGGWKGFKLTDKIGGFIEGGGNFISTLGVPLKLGIGIVAVLVASFAATTLDTATRLQRYVIQELAVQFKFKPLENKYASSCGRCSERRTSSLPGSRFWSSAFTSSAAICRYGSPRYRWSSCSSCPPGP